MRSLAVSYQVKTPLPYNPAIPLLPVCPKEMKTYCSRLNKHPQRYQVLNLGSCRCWFIWIRVSADTIKLSILRLELILDYPVGPKCHYKYPYKRETEGDLGYTQRKEKARLWRGRQRLEGCHHRQAKEWQEPPEAEEPMEGVCPCQHLNFSPKYWFQTSGFQKYGRINFCCFRHPIWQFLGAATRN